METFCTVSLNMVVRLKSDRFLNPDTPNLDIYFGDISIHEQPKIRRNISNYHDFYRQLNRRIPIVKKSRNHSNKLNKFKRNGRIKFWCSIEYFASENDDIENNLYKDDGGIVTIGFYVSRATEPNLIIHWRDGSLQNRHAINGILIYTSPETKKTDKEGFIHYGYYKSEKKNNPPNITEMQEQQIIAAVYQSILFLRQQINNLDYIDYDGNELIIQLNRKISSNIISILQSYRKYAGVHRLLVSYVRLPPVFVFILGRYLY